MLSLVSSAKSVEPRVTERCEPVKASRAETALAGIRSFQGESKRVRNHQSGVVERHRLAVERPRPAARMAPALSWDDGIQPLAGNRSWGGRIGNLTRTSAAYLPSAV